MESKKRRADLKSTRRQKSVEQHRTNADRLPPSSVEAERAVIGTILAEPDCFDWASKTIGGRPVFYDLRHQRIWSAMLVKRRFDLVSLQQYLKDEGELADAGGIAYLVEMQMDALPSSGMSYHLDILIEKYRLRKLIQVGTNIVSQAYEGEGDLDRIAMSARAGFEMAIRGDSLPKFETYSPEDLEGFDLENDPDNLVGNRYATRGSTILLNGASGRGKSSLLMMRIMLWATGQSFLGMKPVRPLSFVVWQTENNKGDMAKAYQGARNYLRLNPIDNGEAYELLQRNVTFTNCSGLCGDEFLNEAELFLASHPKDFAVIDPLISFPEGDLLGIGDFLRKGLSNVTKKTGVGWIVNHHTPKPLRGPQGKGGGRKRLSDYQYAGAGTFDLPGWARAVETLEEAQDGVFRLIIAKRTAEAGATHPDGTATGIIWIRHATDGGIHWEHMEPPTEAETAQERKGGKPSDKVRIAGSNLHTFCSACVTDGEGLNAIAKRLEQWLAKQGEDLGITTCKAIVRLLVMNGKLTKGDDSFYRKGPNA